MRRENNEARQTEEITDEQIRDVYLGDGLYASWDGYQIRLYTERANGTHEVFIDGPTLARFQMFISALQKSLNARRDG